MRASVVVAACAVALCLAGADPAHTSVLLSSWGPSSLSVFGDGSVRTIVFTETTDISLCFDRVGVRGATTINPISDGTSNTILFDEARSPFDVNVGIVRPRQPVTDIADGSSRTITLGETLPTDSFCLGEVNPLPEIHDGTSNTIEFGENSSFDVCVDNARLGRITDIGDGTSNTIVLDETVTPRHCIDGVTVGAPTVAAAPEPGPFAAFGFAVLSLGVAARRAAQRPR